MVSCIGPLATISREPRQARKGAAAAVDSGAGMWLVWDATNCIRRLQVFRLSLTDRQSLSRDVGNQG